jgi:hypothetical protein
MPNLVNNVKAQFHKTWSIQSIGSIKVKRTYYFILKPWLKWYKGTKTLVQSFDFINSKSLVLKENQNTNLKKYSWKTKSTFQNKHGLNPQQFD